MIGATTEHGVVMSLPWRLRETNVTLIDGRPRLSSDRVAFGSVLFALAVLQFLLCAHTFRSRSFSHPRTAQHRPRLPSVPDFARTRTRESGKVDRLRPVFAAGYLGGIGLDPSARLPALLAYVLQQWLLPAQSYKLYVFAASILGPVCVPFAVRLLHLSTRTALIAAALGVCLFWASAFRWYHTAGLVSFVLASYLACRTSRW